MYVCFVNSSLFCSFKMFVLHIADSIIKNIAYFCNVLINLIIMKSRFVFKVEKKIGSLPDVSFKCVFEREVLIDTDVAHPSLEQVVSVLSFLFPDHRVVVTSDSISLPFNE